jgi:hypothetical protein
MCFEGDVRSMVWILIRCHGLQENDDKFEWHGLRLQENQVRVLMFGLGSLESLKKLVR